MPTSHKWIYFAYIVVWSIMAIDPKYPEDWLLENVLVFIFFPVVIWLDIKYRLSMAALLMLLLFASLHSLGSHYTYAEMEYFNAITQFFGFERNHFDRVVHFLFGLLVFRTLFEVARHYVSAYGTALLFSFTLIVTISTLYELLEWAAALLLHPDLGMAFLGTQGDMWDAHKDTLLATVGALFTMMYLSLARMIRKK